MKIKPGARQWLILSGLLAAPFYLSLIIILGVLEPGFSHLSMPMSLLGGVPGARGVVFNIAVVTTSVLVLVFAVALCRLLPPSTNTTVALVLFLVGGLGLLGAGVFHCTEGCRNVLVAPTWVGRLHALGSLLAGMGTGLALIFVWLALRRSARLRRLAAPTLGAALLANGSGILYWLSFATGLTILSLEGLVQRVGLIVTLLWMLYTALSLYTGRTRVASGR